MVWPIRKERLPVVRNRRKPLEKLISSGNIRKFFEKQLQKATNNYDSDHLFDYGLYKWYRASIDNGIRMILIKVRRFSVCLEPDAIINDILIAAQMNAHKNVLKLIGCCLETNPPIAVYEPAENSLTTLNGHISIFGHYGNPHLLWNSRLRIATEIASAVAYLHTAFSRPIIHRDIHAGNVVLDHHYVAKLLDFTRCIPIPDGKMQVEVAVHTSSGYVPPEYIATGIVIEKTDVYNFGLLLMVILTGRRLYESRHESSLPDFLEDCLKRGRISEMVGVDSSTILKGRGGIHVGVQQQVKAAVELALRCIETVKEEIPTMVEVVNQLEQIARCAP